MPQSAPLPTYLRLAETISRDIAAGRLKDGQRLPTEREMAAAQGVAVGTLRKALAELEGRGLLMRRQGSGNYIRAHDRAVGIYALFRLELIEGGGLPTAELLSLDLMQKPADLPGFGEGPRAHRIRRLRRLSGLAASVEEIWLCASYADRLDRTDLSELLYLHYRRHLGLNITRAEDRIGQSPLPDWTPEAFGMAAGQPAPQVQRLSIAEDGRVAEISRNWFDPVVARYVARLA